jgi:uncharacterized damage-inducible protein DinB
MTAHLEAGLAALEEQFDAMVALLRPLEADCLNWRPPVPETNSIAAMVTHTCGSIDGWLARALVESIDRNRDAEFETRADAAALVALVERCRVETRRRIEALQAVDPATIRSVRRLSRGQDQQVSVAWCLEHAIIHAGEHWGQIQLTKQLYAARR